MTSARQYGVAEASGTQAQVVWVSLAPSPEALAGALPVPVGIDGR